MNKYKRWEKEFNEALNNMSDDEFFKLLEDSGFELYDLPETVEPDVIESGLSYACSSDTDNSNNKSNYEYALAA